MMNLSTALAFGATPLLVFCFSCATPQSAPIPAPTAVPAVTLPSLTREGTLFRLRQVENVHYRARIDLAHSLEQYSVQAEARFDLKAEAKQLGQPILLDLEGASEVRIQINRQAAAAGVYDGHEIRLGPDLLKSTGNRITVSFVHPYVDLASNGMETLGFLKYSDPADKSLFFYTNFEPTGARQVFPCFDQPSLKGTFALDVVAPRAWQIVANTLETKVEELPHAQKLWHFPATRLAPTYVFHLSAGKMVQWSAPEKVHGVPLRLFARPSVAAKIDGDAWLSDTATGLAYFDKTFGTSYPFQKLDQVILPAYPGSMENLAAIGIGEMLATGPRPGASERAYREMFLFHELVHHWFGNLVSVKWWGDLALVEGFCDLFNLKGIKDTLRYKDVDALRELLYIRALAMELSPAPLTLIRDVPDARSLDSFLSPLLIVKSSVALEDFERKIGPDAFLRLVRTYIRRFAFKNADAKDFYRLAEQELHQDFESWRKPWYEEIHVVHVSIAVACKEPGSGGDTESCPQLYIPGSANIGYAEPELDPKSLPLAQRSISRFQDPLERMILWLGLWNSVREKELAPLAFLAAIADELPSETQPEVAVRMVWLASHPGSPSVSPGVIQQLAEADQAKAKSELASEIRARMAAEDASGDLGSALRRALNLLK